FNVPGPIAFNDKTYHLAWSSNPTKTYYKHEYIPKGQTPEKFEQMLMLDLILGNDFTVADVASSQVAQLEKRKATDAVVQYEAIENPETGEIILDFLISSGTGKTLDIVEWNAYRYKPFQEKSGRKGVLLFAISTRGYAGSIPAFLTGLKTTRTPQIHAIGGHPFLEVTLKQ
ncbi:MAG TPA: hypothetical protein VK927_08025, partial [Adhaeribacter sp.]|nr:hypothetical protein [Adhaeribacter sp.]